MAEAEEVLIRACERFESTADPFSELAKLSTEKGEYEEAVQRWDVVLRQFPMFEEAYVPAAHALREVRRDARQIGFCIKE